MNRNEAKKELDEMRPYKPRSSKGRRKQKAIDIAIETIEAYENLLNLISKDSRPDLCLNCEHCCYSSVNSNGEIIIKCKLGATEFCKENKI